MPVTEHELEERAIAPRVNLEQVENSILFTYFFTAAEGYRGATNVAGRLVGKSESLETLTFCVLVLKNGFTVVGQSNCADPKNFQRDIGERIARDDAVKKIWAFLGFELRTKLSVTIDD